ncbi:hypothetical protein [Nocardioides sp. GXZ039]|uniref:hypothetical protein n=1 Tax=Nocardioides sp. GXZ039 TaxID=3136018 RepID=UPI0030F47CB7
MSGSDEHTDDLAEQPEPQAEPKEPPPGGVDSIDHDTGREHEPGGPVAHDLDPDDNPAVEDALPDEMKQLEDTSTQATESEDPELEEDEEESPA